MGVKLVQSLRYPWPTVYAIVIVPEYYALAMAQQPEGCPRVAQNVLIGMRRVDEYEINLIKIRSEIKSCRVSVQLNNLACLWAAEKSRTRNRFIDVFFLDLLQSEARL